MDKNFTFGIIDGENTVTFCGERLKPFEQFNLILRIIGIVAKGSKNSSPQVEQALHNVFQTGTTIETGKGTVNIDSFTLILDAIKGALSSLSDDDRDWLLKQLLKNVQIQAGTALKVDATIDEINDRFSGFQPIIRLLIHLVKVNLGFL